MKQIIRFLVLVFPVMGSAMITADNSLAETDPFGSTGFNWDNVYHYKNSSAVAVDPYWILTAAHVADDSFNSDLVIGSTTYTQQEIVFHESADLALVRYDMALPGYDSLFTGSYSSSAEMLMVGFGNTGSVVDSPGPNDYFTDSGSGSGTKRWGTQQYSSLENKVYDAGGGTTTNSGFWMDFLADGTDNEAGVGVHDSGGGTFVNDGGTWKLAGINTIRADNGTGGQYVSSFSVSVQDYEPWISQTVPEPVTVSLLSGAGLAILMVNRIRRRIL